MLEASSNLDLKGYGAEAKVADNTCDVEFMQLGKGQLLELRSLQPLFLLKCKNLPKYTKFRSPRKLEVAAKNFSLLTKNRLMHWQIRGLKGSISGNFCVVCLNL